MGKVGTKSAESVEQVHAKDVVVIVPTFNERPNLSELVERIFAVAQQDSWDLQVLIVDDRSPDGTAGSARREALKHGGRVKVLERQGPRGLALSVLDGIQIADAPTIVVMDGDLSHRPEELPSLVRPIRERKAEFVVGSRYVVGGTTPGFGALRRIESAFATSLVRPLVRVRDPMSGFFAFSKELLATAPTLNPTGYKIALELLVRTGCRAVAEVPIRFETRRGGRSKLGLREQFQFVLHVARLYAFAVLRRFKPKRQGRPVVRRQCHFGHGRKHGR